MAFESFRLIALFNAVYYDWNLFFDCYKGFLKIIDEFIYDYRNSLIDDGTRKFETYEEKLSNMLKSSFVSDYYETKEFGEADEVDFEVIQNNYSNRLLVGIDMKVTGSKNFSNYANSIMFRQKDKFIYLFLINLNIKNEMFEVIYLTKSNVQKLYTINFKK